MNAVRLGLATAVALLLVSAPASAAPVQAAATRPPAAASGTMSLRLTQVTPAAVTTRGMLTVTGTLTNGTRRKLKGAHVVLTVHRERLGNREDVEAWQDGDTDAVADRPLPVTGNVRTVRPGSSAHVRLVVPTGGLGLNAAAWAFGPRGITVQIRDRGQRVIASQRTLIVWSPTRSYQPTALSLLVPITPGVAGPAAGAPTAAADAELRAGGRLDRVLTAGQDPAVSWAFDPSVLAAADALARGGTSSGEATATPSGTSTTSTTSTTTTSTTSGTPGSSAGATSSSAGPPETEATKTGRQWLARFGGGVGHRDMIELPYADPDINSVLDNKGVALLRMAEQLGRRVTRQVVGRTFDSHVAWPGDGRATSGSVSPLVRSANTGVLIASSTQEVLDSQITPTGRSTITGGGHSIDGLLYDTGLSSLAAGSGSADPVIATQELLGQLAAITLEQPETSRHVLAVTPRDWNPNPAGFAAMLAALRSSPWVQLSPLRSLRALDPVTDRAEPDFPARAKAAELPLGTVDRALVLRRRIEAFAPAMAADQTAAVLDPYREQIASLLSVAWRRDRTDLAAAGTEVERRTDRLADGVRLNVGSPEKWFTARASSIQFGVQNRTDHDLHLVVDVRAGSGQLVVTSVKVTVEANSRTNVQVPSRSVASGDVTVTAALRNPDGGALDQSQHFLVHVRPGWETKGVIGAGSVLGLLLVIGLLRGVRRSRDRVPPTPVPDVDDLAVQHRRAEQRALARAEAAQDQKATPERVATPEERAHAPVGGTRAGVTQEDRG